jgi:hypothetical protein
MRRRGLGVLLILTLLVAAGTLLQDVRFDRALQRERASAATIDRELAALDVALVSFSAAQTGYVATGQGPSFWMTHASDLSAEIDAGLARLKSMSASADARTRYDAAMSALADITAIDSRARDLVRKDQRFAASDLIFVDSVDATGRFAAEVAAARGAEKLASEERLTRTSRLRLGLTALALGFVMLVALFFWRIAARESAAAQTSATAGRLGLASEPAPRTAAEPPAHAPASNADLEPSGDINLAAAAELCIDLARVIDGRDVPALVERAATVLDAKGLILWIVDSSGAMLRPMLTHGYSDRILARLGRLQMDADNVTSLAFRSMRPQAVPGAGPGDPGAIAVPLITPTGCIGVLAAETRQSRPDRNRLSVARMIAAQFATIVPGSTDAARSARA